MDAPARRRRKAAAPQAKPAGAKVRALTAYVSERRYEILDAAARRIADHGFEATTVRQIADDVGILSGSLYHHFATKDDMLHEIVRDAVQKMRANTLRIAHLRADAEHRLIALILLELGEITANQKVHAILTNERRLFRNRPEFRYVLKAKMGIYRAWRKVLQDGIKAKLFRSDTDIFLTILTILRMLNNAADWFKNDEAHGLGDADDSSYSLDTVIDFHIQFVLNGIRSLARASERVDRLAGETLVRGQE